MPWPTRQEREMQKSDQPLTPEEEEIRLKRARRSRDQMDPGEGPAEFIKLFHGVDVNSVEESVRFLLKNPLTDAQTKVLGTLVLATSLSRALRGDAKAMELLIRYAVHQPNRGFTGRVQDMNREEIAAEIEAEWRMIGAPEDLTTTLMSRAKTPDADAK